MSRRSSTLQYHIAAVLAVSIWGGSFICTKELLLAGMTPVAIYVVRFVIAYLLTLMVCPRPLRARSWRDEGLFAVCGLCGGSLYFITENVALEYTLVTNVSLITSLSPLLTALLLGVLYRSERPGKGLLIGSAVALTGVACVIFNSSFQLEVKPLGDLLSLLAAVCWAVYSIALRPLTATYSAWFITRKTFFYGVVTALPFFMADTSMPSWQALTTTRTIVCILFLGILASMAAYMLWSSTIKRLGATKASNYLYFQPIITLILSAVMLGEHVSIVGYLGCALILGGVILGDKLSGTDRGNSPH